MIITKLGASTRMNNLIGAVVSSGIAVDLRRKDSGNVRIAIPYKITLVNHFDILVRVSPGRSIRPVIEEVFIRLVEYQPNIGVHKINRGNGSL